MAAWRDGELVLLRRADRVINVRGRKVDPSEVGARAGRHGRCDEAAAAVGVAAPDGHDEIVRAVLACPSGRLSYEDVAAWCRTRLADHKVPRSIIIVNTLPYDVRGKIDRDAFLVAISPSVADPASRPHEPAAGSRPPASPLLTASAGLHAAASVLAASPIVAARPLERWSPTTSPRRRGHVPAMRMARPQHYPSAPAARQRGVVALTFDDGPDPVVTPVVLDLLDQAGAMATFFCVGRRAGRILPRRSKSGPGSRRGEPHLQPPRTGSRCAGPRVI